MKQIILLLAFFTGSVYCFSQDITITRTTMTNDCTLGYMAINRKTIAYTLEEPWHDNIGFISCVPEGLYDANIRFDKSDHWRIELLNVPKRGGVQIHIGNDTSDITGCVLVGTGVDVNTCYLTGSKTAYNLMKTINQFIDGQKLTVRFINPTQAKEHKVFTSTYKFIYPPDPYNIVPENQKKIYGKENTCKITFDGDDVIIEKSTSYKYFSHICKSNTSLSLKDVSRISYREQPADETSSGYISVYFTGKGKVFNGQNFPCMNTIGQTFTTSSEEGTFSFAQKEDFLSYLQKKNVTVVRF